MRPIAFSVLMLVVSLPYFIVRARGFTPYVAVVFLILPLTAATMPNSLHIMTYLSEEDTVWGMYRPSFMGPSDTISGLVDTESLGTIAPSYRLPSKHLTVSLSSLSTKKSTKKKTPERKIKSLCLATRAK